MSKGARLVAAGLVVSLGMSGLGWAAGSGIAVVGETPAFCLPDPGLQNARRVGVTPDGAHVYVIGKYLSAWARQPNGALVFVEEEQAVNFLPGNLPSTALPRFVVAPNGAHLYVVAESKLWVFQRDLPSGALTFVESQQDGLAGVTGMAGSSAVVVSPDDASVYVGTRAGNVVAFARDALTGALSYVATYSGATIGLDEIVDLVVSPDGAHVYVGGDDDTTSPGESKIVRLLRDGGTGTLAVAETTVVAGSSGIAYLTGSLDGTSLYASAPAGVRSFARDAGTGSLSLVGTLVPALGHKDLEVAADGAHAYGGGTDVTTVFTRDPGTGALSAPQFIIAGAVGTLGLRDTFAISSDGATVYFVSSLFGGTVVAYSRDDATGDLTFLQGLGQADASPVRLAISPDEEHLYATCSVGPGQGDTVVVLDRDPATGGVVEVDRIRHALDVPDGLRQPAAILASGDGMNVYVVALNDAGECVLTTFERDPGSGSLSYLESEFAIAASPPPPGFSFSPCGMHVTESPDGGNVYGAYNFQVLDFDRDPILGTLTLAQSTTLPAPARGLTVTPSGSHVVATTTEGTVVAFARDGLDGSLGAVTTSFIQVGTLEHPVFAPDGILYAITEFPGVLWSLDYDPTTGETDVLFKEPRTGAVAGLALHAAEGYLVGANLDFGPTSSSDRIVTYRRDATGAAFLADLIDGDPEPLSGAGVDVVASVAAPDVYVARGRAEAQLLQVRRLPACTAVPMTGCRTSVRPGSGLLFVSHPGNPERSKLKWRLIRGEAAVPADFGDPATTTGQTLCLYDASGTGDSVVTAQVRPGGSCGPKPCWKTTRRGFSYKASPPDRHPDGVAKMTLKTGLAGKSAIKVVVAGGPLALPTTAFVPPIVAQLQGTDGSCWENTVSAPLINVPGKLKGKAD